MVENFSHALISASELAEQLNGPIPPILLDIRWQVGQPALYEQFRAGHLPGARWCDLDKELAGPPGDAGRHPLPDPAALQHSIERWGIDDGDRIVVYDGGTSVGAARAWWVLRWAGLSDVRVLDGGYAAWLEAGQPVTTEIEPVEPGTATVRPDSLPSLTAEQAADWGAAGRLIDVRAPERFRGEVEPLDPVAGHIPGAANVPTTGNLAASGRLLDPSAIRQRFAGYPIDDEPIGVYCGSGVTAAHTLLALHTAGIPAVLYPGSWSEWITDPARPVATGE